MERRLLYWFVVRKASIGFVLAAGLGVSYWLLRRDAAPSPVQRKGQYAAANACVTCHAGIAASYRSSGMARAFYRPTPETVPDVARSQFHHAPSQRYYRMTWRDGKLWQRRWQQNAGGREENVLELEAHYVIGSGNHARTFLHREGNGEITELPLSWYAEDDAWGMSPGFDKPRHFDFTRQIDHGCMFCHNAYPELQAGEDKFGRLPAFPAELPQGIDCQRCHGPGAEHAELATQGNPVHAVRDSIENPKRLTAERQLDVCLQCHLETTSAALPASTRRFGRGAYSYRPGEPLTDFVVHFDHEGGHTDKFEIVGAAYRLRQSPCFVASGGKLTCTTCHDPHKVARGDAARKQFRDTCLGCHAKPARHEDRMESCTECHMPKRRTEDAVRVVMTDHRIGRKPGQGLLAARKEKDESYRGPVALYYPRELPEREAGAYRGIALSAHSADAGKGIPMLEHSAGLGEPKVFTVLGDARMAKGEWRGAAEAYAQALRLDPGLEKARFNYAQALDRTGDGASALREYMELVSRRSGFVEAQVALGDLLAKSGHAARAEAAYREALRGRSAYAPARRGLGALYLTEGKLAEAKVQFDGALQADPDYAPAHNELARWKAAQGDLAGAMSAVGNALQREPENVDFQLNRARLLYLQGRHAAAMAEFERIVRAHPAMAEAHMSLGVAYGEAGRNAEAASQFEAVLRLEPDNAEARRNLALVNTR